MLIPKKTYVYIAVCCVLFSLNIQAEGLQNVADKAQKLQAEINTTTANGEDISVDPNLAISNNSVEGQLPSEIYNGGTGLSGKKTIPEGSMQLDEEEANTR